MSIALLVIDVQDAFVGEQRTEKTFDEKIAYINYASHLFRKYKQPVYMIRDISEGDGPEYLVVDVVNQEESDRRLEKTFNNSFWQTDLEDKLKEDQVDYLVLCGNAAEYCVLATYNGAIERGYGVAMLQKGVFSTTESGRLDAFENRSLISCSAIEYLLKLL